ncbi:hypothetical protein CDD83_4000 [Cordyceps sp. RAO-2017]|nr:hypothetical protein CDD83_4000 [Cordyceps sp. RAO-2017]
MLHPSVQVYRDARTGLSFRVAPAAAAPLPALEPVVSVPTALTLSYLDARAPVRHRSRDDDRGCSGSSRDDDHDCSGSSALPEAFLAAAPPHVVGRVFLVREYLRGRDSFWWPYIQALPRPDDAESWALPPFWCAEEAELLEGTNVEIGMDKIRSDVRREHADALRLLRLCDEPLAAALTATLYRWAYCVFSSRSFRPSLVLSESQQRRLPPGVSIDHFSVLFPLFDIGNHDMTTDIRWDLDDAGRSCELRVDRPHAPGQQIFNNYSMKTNAELLLGYGFMVPAADDLHNDYTHVRKRTTAAPVASDEYLISLRPVAHPSSLLARTKQTLRLDPSVQVLGAFQHLQPDMVWDIFCTLAPAEQHEQLIPAPRGLAADAAECHRRNRFFSGQVEGEGRMYLEQTMALIQHKVLQELERLNETDVELVGGNADLLSRNQKLALDYRERCRRVLENTLESMSQDELPADVVDGH